MRCLVVDRQDDRDVELGVLLLGRSVGNHRRKRSEHPAELGTSRRSSRSWLWCHNRRDATLTVWAQIASARARECARASRRGRRSGRASDARGNEARWLRGLVFGTVSVVVAFGAVGLVTAIAGVYRTYVVFPVGVLVWIGLLALACPLLVVPGATSRTAHVVAGAGVAFVGAMSLWNIRHASQHVLINRDGGAYTNAGRWIAMHGNLRVVAAVGPFACEPALTFGSFGMYPTRWRNAQLSIRPPAACLARRGAQPGRRPPHVRGDASALRSRVARVLRRGLEARAQPVRRARGAGELRLLASRGVVLARIPTPRSRCRC